MGRCSRSMSAAVKTGSRLCLIALICWYFWSHEPDPSRAPFSTHALEDLRWLPPAYNTPRYLLFELCGDLGEQLLSVLDGLAFSYEANATAVISHFGGAGYQQVPVEMMKPLLRMVDLAHLANVLQPNLTLMLSLPQSFSYAHGVYELDMAAVPASRRLSELSAKFQSSEAVTIGCPLRTFQWVHPRQGALRRQVLRNILPSAAMATQVERAQAQLGGRYNCLSVLLDDDWLRFCRAGERDATASTSILSWRECYLSLERVGDFLKRWHPPLERPLYIGGADEGQARSLRHLGYTTATRASVGGDLENSESSALFDWFMCSDATDAAVNSYSSLAFLLKEHRLAASNLTTLYYNRITTSWDGTLSKDEQNRWGLGSEVYSLPGWSSGAWSSEVEFDGEDISGYLRVPKTCSPHLSSWSCKAPEVKLMCSVEGRGTWGVPVALVERTMSGEYHFRWRLPLTAPGRHVLHVWAQSADRDLELEGSPIVVNIKPMQVYLYFPNCKNIASGGPEALHQLHHELIRQFGEVSGIYTGNSAYRKPWSRYMDFWSDDNVNARDVVIIPEFPELPGDFTKHMRARGAKTVKWILGQLTDHMREITVDKEAYMPICLTRYFADVFSCVPKAQINTPMGEAFYSASRHGTVCDNQACPKRDLILIDADPKELAFSDFSLERVKDLVGPGAEVVLLHGFSRLELVELYKSAKVIVDAFITGQERMVFESSLFNVLPLVAWHGSARDQRDFPIPRQYMWDLSNYTALGNLIRMSLTSYESMLSWQAHFKKETLAMPARFPQQVANFFADNVLFYIVCTDRQEEEWAVPTVLNLLINFPFADVELVVTNDYYFRYDNAPVLDFLQRKGLSGSLTLSKLGTHRNHYLPRTSFLLERPSARHQTAFIYQWAPGMMVFEPDHIKRMVQAYKSNFELAERHGILEVLPARGQSPEAAMLFYSYEDHLDTLASPEAEPGRLADTAALDRGTEQLARDFGMLYVRTESDGLWNGAAGGGLSRRACENLSLVRQQDLWKANAKWIAPEPLASVGRLASACQGR